MSSSQIIHLGFDSINHLPDVLHSLGGRRIFLVTGNKSFSESGAQERLKKLLAGFDVVRFNGCPTNPTFEDVKSAVDTFRQAKSDIIIGIGGGAAMDMAKMVKFFSSRSEQPDQLIDLLGKIEPMTIPIVAIPTTAGSGSEATHFAVVYRGFDKFSVAHPALLPDAAIVDPQFTLNLSPRQTASSGMDAFSQGIESFWSVRSTIDSQRDATIAISKSIEHLRSAVKGNSHEAREEMSIAAYHAGKAINVSRTTASHAVSYPITIKYGVPHGHAVGLTLGEMLVHNASSDAAMTDPRGPEYLAVTIAKLIGLLGCHDAEDARNYLYTLMEEIGLSTNLPSLGIASAADVEFILDHVNTERLDNNPRRVSREALRQILLRRAGMTASPAAS